MTIYYILIFVIIFAGCIINEIFDKTEAGDEIHKRRVFLIISSIIIWVIIALRSVSVGADTLRYFEIYNDHLYGTGMHVFHATTEWGFAIFQNMLSMVVSDRVYLMVVAAIIVFSFSLFFWHNSENMILSIILHITIGLFAFTLSGIRQSLAICLTLFAFQLAKEKKLIRFIVIVMIAYLFHNSAICFLPVYFIVKVKTLNKVYSIFILVVTAVVGIFSKPVISFIQLIAPQKFSGLFSNSNGINSKSFIFYFGILLLCAIVLLYENENIVGSQAKYFIMACISALVYAVAPNVFLLDRIALYFIPYNILLISNSITNMKHLPSRRFAMIITIAFGVVWFSISIPGEAIQIDNYTFMWQR